MPEGQVPFAWPRRWLGGGHPGSRWGCRRVGVVLERLDEPLENRSQGRWNGPAVDGGQQVPVPLNPWVIGDLQSDQQLAAVVGGVGLAERLGVAADQIGQDQTGLLGRWVDPVSSRRLDPFSDLVGQFV